MGKALLQEGLQRVVVRIGDGIFSENTVEDFGPVGGTSARERIRVGWVAVWGRIGTQADQINGSTGSRSTGDGASRHDSVERAGSVWSPWRGAADIGHV